MSGKGKGSEWERKVCKFLSKWIQGTENPYLFWRQPASGGIATISQENAENLSGDIRSISPLSEDFCNKFCIECKSGYKSTSFDKHFKYNISDPLKSFWVQVSNDAEKSNKKQMLIYKKKGLPTPWIGIDTEIYSKLNPHFKGLRFIHIGWGMEKLEDIWFFEMNEFFDRVTPENIKELK